LVVIVSVVDADRGSCADANAVVVIGIDLEPRQPGLIDVAGGAVDAEPVEEGAAVSGNREPEPVRSEESDQRLGNEVSADLGLGFQEVVTRDRQCRLSGWARTELGGSTGRNPNSPLTTSLG
jgi:hypothetical protein